MSLYIINEHEVTDPVAFERYPALAAPRSFAPADGSWRAASDLRRWREPRPSV